MIFLPSGELFFISIIAVFQVKGLSPITAIRSSPLIFSGMLANTRMNLALLSLIFSIWLLII